MMNSVVFDTIHRLTSVTDRTDRHRTTACIHVVDGDNPRPAWSWERRVGLLGGGSEPSQHQRSQHCPPQSIWRSAAGSGAKSRPTTIFGIFYCWGNTYKRMVYYECVRAWSCLGSKRTSHQNFRPPVRDRGRSQPLGVKPPNPWQIEHCYYYYYYWDMLCDRSVHRRDNDKTTPQ